MLYYRAKQALDGAERTFANRINLVTDEIFTVEEVKTPPVTHDGNPVEVKNINYWLVPTKKPSRGGGEQKQHSTPWRARSCCLVTHQTVFYTDMSPVLEIRASVYRKNTRGGRR